MRSPVAAKVAVVLSSSGHNLFVKRSSGGGLVPLARGAVLYMHDIVAAGPGTKLSLRLVRHPKVAKGTKDLLDFYKQLSKSTPRPASVIREFFIGPYAATEFRTVNVSRPGRYIEIALRP